MSAQVSAVASYPANTKNPASWTPEQRQAYRMEWARANNESVYRVGADGKSAVVMVERAGVMLAAGFRGTRLKPAFNYRFQSAEYREKYVSEWIAANDRAAAETAAHRAETKAKHSLKVGDILYSSWGYDQTNIGFFEVVAVRGCAVDLRKLAQDKTNTNSMQGTCKAKPGEYIDDPIIGKRPNGRNTVRIDSCETASPWDGRSLSWSSYA